MQSFSWLARGRPDRQPASVTAWAAATNSRGGAIWGVGGIASDGENPFVTTGNTFNTGGRLDGRGSSNSLPTGPIFTGLPADYWAPVNWLTLDNEDKDLGSSGPLLVDVPGATPSGLVVAIGKDGNAYLLDSNDLGGISEPVASSHVFNWFHHPGSGKLSDKPGYVCRLSCRGGRPSRLQAFRITATNPPAIVSRWSVNRNGCGSPFVTSTDGTHNMIVWVVGTEGDQQLHGYDGDTSAIVYAGGGRTNDGGTASTERPASSEAASTSLVTTKSMLSSCREGRRLRHLRLQRQHTNDHPTNSYFDSKSKCYSHTNRYAYPCTYSYTHGDR